MAICVFATTHYLYAQPYMVSEASACKPKNQQLEGQTNFTLPAFVFETIGKGLHVNSQAAKC